MNFLRRFWGVGFDWAFRVNRVSLSIANDPLHDSTESLVAGAQLFSQPLEQLSQVPMFFSSPCPSSYQQSMPGEDSLPGIITAKVESLKTSF